MAMQSGQSPTESPINQTAENEIKTNVIISDVTKEAGQIHYYISDIQKDKIPSRIFEPPILQPVKNIPPCSCAIQQMTDKDISLFASKDDIPWTKEEGLCPGKKYRPDEPGAYSCKTYPGDKFCRHNPFMKEIMKMEKRKIEKQEKEEKMKKMIESIEMVKKETQLLQENIMERKKDKFIPDLNYPAYDDPWNILRTAPSAKITKTDYEATLKLTSPAWPTASSSLITQERRNDISSSKELKKIKNNILDKENNNKTFKFSSKSPNKIQKDISEEKKEIKGMKKKKEPIFLKKITVNKRGTKSSNTISGSTATFETKKKQQMKPLLHNKPIKQFSKINKLPRYNPVKKNKKKNIIDEAEEINNRKREMARLKNMFKSFAETLGDIQPAILPGELPAISQRSEKKTEEIITSSAADDEEKSRRIKEGSCGWRTRSEQELPTKKTIAYLCEPDYPLETIAVRPGGRPCQCRENRNKKKILAYNVGGLVEKKDGKRIRRTKLEEENRIIDGVFYFTPPISPRRSDEYIPEYDLLESPYDMCVSEATEERLKLIEKYSGPKSLIEKIRRKPKSCNCNNNVTKKDRLVNQLKDLEDTRKKLMESKSPEERWKIALKDAALMDYFTQREDNAPCWTSCKKIARTGR